MPRTAIAIAAGFAALVSALAWAALAWLPETAYFPYVMMKPAPGFTVEFMLGGHTDAAACTEKLTTLRSALGANCPGCDNVVRCDRGLGERHRRALGGQPLDTVSIRLAEGALLVHADRVADAQAVCEAIHRQMQSGQSPAGPCISAGQPRPRKL